MLADWFRNLGLPPYETCGCGHCGETVDHASDCAVHNGPSSDANACDCGPEPGEPIIPEHEARQPVSTAERRSRGLRARLEFEQTEAAFDHMIRTAVAKWAETKPDETAKREEAYRLVHVVKAVRERLRTVIADGEVAAAEQKYRPAESR